jgi:hypothetical protein
MGLVLQVVVVLGEMGLVLRIDIDTNVMSLECHVTVIGMMCLVPQVVNIGMMSLIS